MLTLPQLNKIAQNDPHTYEALKSIQAAINELNTRIGVDPRGAVAPPPNIAALSVAAANGSFIIGITDNPVAVGRGINYFVEYDTAPGFPAPIVLDLGASRNLPVFLGNQTLYFRAYSQYENSVQSARVVFGGSTPTAVVGGGVAAPVAPASSGSGGAGGGGGFGGAGEAVRLLTPRDL